MSTDNPIEEMYDPRNIGDGVTVGHDSYSIWLTTPRGCRIESIALEPAVFQELLRYVRDLEINFNSPGFWLAEFAPPKD